MVEHHSPFAITRERAERKIVVSQLWAMKTTVRDLHFADDPGNVCRYSQSVRAIRCQGEWPGTVLNSYADAVSLGRHHI